MAKTITAPSYPTDAKPAIQAVLNSIDVNRGDTVLLPQGRYKAGALTSNIQGLYFTGEAMPGLEDFNNRGSTQIVVPSGLDGLVLGQTGQHKVRGFGLERLHFIGEGTGTGRGVAIIDAERCIL